MNDYWLWVIVILLSIIVVYSVSRNIKFRQAQAASSIIERGKPGDHTYTLMIDDVERQYIVHVPPTYAPSSHHAVVLNFHGGGKDAQHQIELSQMNTTSDAYGFLVVYPEGIPNLMGWGRCWNAGLCCGRAKRLNINDVKFTAAIIDDLGTKYSIDARRVFATGMSNGAMMAYRLACELADRIAAIAPVAATIGVEDCRPSRAVSIMHFHGTADEFVPVHGGRGKNRADIHWKSVAETTAMFAKINGCHNVPEVTYRHGPVTCMSYPFCKDNAEVAFCSIERSGHTWPGGNPYPKGGETSYDLSANEAMWRFFMAHPMP